MRSSYIRGTLPNSLVGVCCAHEDVFALPGCRIKFSVTSTFPDGVASHDFTDIVRSWGLTRSVHFTSMLVQSGADAAQRDGAYLGTTDLGKVDVLDTQSDPSAIDLTARPRLCAAVRPPQEKSHAASCQPRCQG